jgi:hypothetical protein
MREIDPSWSKLKLKALDILQQSEARKEVA